MSISLMNLCLNHGGTGKGVCIKCEEDKSEVKSEAIKSDGGKSDYYLITVNGQTFMAEDFIKQVFGNDFDYGNNFKASLRAYALKNGTAKEGSTIGYETNKMKYYAGQIEKHNE
jgi:hypothetical protein